MQQLSESTVITICTYNNAQLLDKTLAALEQQKCNSLIQWSVLVVDNNCTDETSTVVQKYINAGHIPGLKRVQEPQQGLGFARRCAIRETTAELIAFVDDDCLLSPDWVAEAYQFCQQHPQAGAIGGKVELLWEVQPEPTLIQFSGYLASQDRGDVAQQLPTVGNTYLVGAGLVIRRSALLASGWLDQMVLVGRNGNALTAGDDSEMVLRIRNAGYELWYNPKMQLQHFIPKRRISVTYFCRLLQGIGQSQPILHLLGCQLKPTLWVRVQLLYQSTGYLVKVGTSIIYRYLLIVHAVPVDRQIYLSHAFGNLKGALKLLMRGYQV